jgi:hypothetical protein
VLKGTGTDLCPAPPIVPALPYDPGKKAEPEFAFEGGDAVAG